MRNWQIHRIEVQPGHTWFVKDSKTARAGKHTLVFIHGRFSSHGNWMPQMEHFRRQGHRVIAYDLDGHEQSTGDGGLSLKEHAEGLKKLLDELHVSRAVFIGHSDGGAIAQQFTADHRERVHALALVNTYRRIPEDIKTLIGKLSELYDLEKEGVGPLRALRLTKLKINVARMLTENQLTSMQLMRMFFGRNSRTALDVLQKHSLAFNNAEVPLIEQHPPMCVIHTEDDPLVTSVPPHEFREIYGVQPHILRIKTHFPHILRPKEVTKILNGFVAGLHYSKPGN